MPESNNNTKIDLKKLSKPFAEKDVEWTPTHSYPRNPESIHKYNMYCSPFINREAKILRLNTVVGLGNWQTELRNLGSKGMLSGIALKNGNDWAWYWDGAAYDQDRSNIDPVKMVNTQAFKRSTEILGIGLYLKKFSEKANLLTSWEPGATKIKPDKVPASLNVQSLYWAPPKLPAHLLPTHCTPEQYHLLKQYDNCVIDNFQQGIDPIISGYENNDPVLYNEACDLIREIENNQRSNNPPPPRPRNKQRPKGKPAKKKKKKGSKGKDELVYTDPRLMPKDADEKEWEELITLVKSITSATMPEQKDIMQVKNTIKAGKMNADRVIKAINHLQGVKKKVENLPF